MLAFSAAHLLPLPAPPSFPAHTSPAGPCWLCRSAQPGSSLGSAPPSQRASPVWALCLLEQSWDSEIGSDGCHGAGWGTAAPRRPGVRCGESQARLRLCRSVLMPGNWDPCHPQLKCCPGEREALAEQKADLRCLKWPLGGACTPPLMVRGSLKQLNPTREVEVNWGTPLGTGNLLCTQMQESPPDPSVMSRTYQAAFQS